MHFLALLKQVWVESEPIRRVHEARLTAKRQLGTDPRIPLPGRACGGLLRMWGGVATGRPACQRATRVLRCAPVLRMTRRPSLRSESSYGPCGPAWTGASRPSTTSRRTREEQSARGPDVRGSRGEAEPANAGVFLAGAASNWGHPYPHLFQALLKQVWVESEPIRRVHEARLTAKRQLGTDPRIPLPGRACGGLLRMWGGVATGRPACQRATRVLRCAPVLRMTRRPSLRSESSYGPCGPAWTGASRPSTTSRRTREEQSARGPDVRGSRGEAEPANAGVFLAGAASNWGHPYPHLFQETPVSGDSIFFIGREN